MESLYTSGLEIKNYNGIDYGVLSWTPEDLTAKRSGIIAADLLNREAILFNNLQDATKYLNLKRKERGLDVDFSSRHYISKEEVFKKSNLVSENRVIDNLYLAFAFDFNLEKAKKNVVNLSVPVVSDANESFSSIEDAADYLIEKGIAKGSLKTVVSSLKRNLNGQTTKSYGRVWRFDGKHKK